MLHVPPGLAAGGTREVRKFSPVNSNGDVTEFGSVIGDHLSPTFLIQLLPRHLRLLHIGEHAEGTVLTLVHPCVAVHMVANISLNLLQIVEHLLTSSVSQGLFAGDFGVVDVSHARCLHFILLVLHRVGQTDSLASILLILCLPLLDRGEARLLDVEVAVDVGALS